MSNALENQIIIGSLTTPLFTFDNSHLSKVSGVFAVDAVGNQLSVDTVKAELRYNKDEPAVYILGGGTQLYATRDGKLYVLKNALGELRALPYGTPIWWRNDGRTICAGFVRNVERIGRYRYRINIFSGLGLLQTIYHPGGVYTGQTFAAIAADIIGDTFEYTVAPAIADLPVYGWLPYDTRRNNLHQLMFALGVALRRDEAGNPAFVFLTASSPRQIADSRVVFGGSVDYESPATRADVTEHAFYAAATDETITLFDNTDGGAPASNTTVIFSEAPVHDLTATGGLQIIEQHVNYAVVTGTGTLEGKLYTHTRRIVQRDAESPSGAENVKRVEDMTLISIANSQNVAKRVLAYYSSTETVRAQIVLDGERCGDLLSMLDPYFDQMQAFVQEMAVKASTNLLASCVLVEGYAPTGQGNNYSGHELLTGSGEWIVPDGVESITVMIIGGGCGGEAGSAGEKRAPKPKTSTTTSGKVYTFRSYADANDFTPNAGGEAGLPGSGGKVLTLTMAVTPGQTIAFTCGLGGAGATYSGTPAQDGSASVFGSHSSADGAASENGYIDPISGQIFAPTGNAGVKGGDSGGLERDENGAWVEVPETPIVVDGVTYRRGAKNSTVHTAFGGSDNYKYGYGEFYAYASGSFGSGAAYGADGLPGAEGRASTNGYSSATQACAFTGARAHGADALPPPKELIPGKGGAGGNGGGGGALPSWPCYAERKYTDETETPSAQTFAFLGSDNPPRAGKGSDGGDGADGAILIYY